MQSRLKDIARREGIEKFGDRTMIIRINRKMGDDFELTLRSKRTGENRRSVYQFKFRNGELYMAEGPHLVYTASMGQQGDGEEELYRAFKQSINKLFMPVGASPQIDMSPLAVSQRKIKEKYDEERRKREEKERRINQQQGREMFSGGFRRIVRKSWLDIIKRTGKSKGTGLRGRGYKSPKDSTSRRKEDEKEILEPELEELQ